MPDGGTAPFLLYTLIRAARIAQHGINVKTWRVRNIVWALAAWSIEVFLGEEVLRAGDIGLV